MTSEKGSLKLGGSRSVQYLHLLTNQGLGLPTDLWVPATADIPPVKSWEGSIGYHHDLPKNFFFSVETYYKYMKDVTQYREGADFISITESLENKVVSGKGESYGAEFFVQRKKGRFTGWVGYTLSWSTRQYDEINGGEKFFYKYDRRHDVSITGAYQITKKWDVSAVFVFLDWKCFNAYRLRITSVPHHQHLLEVALFKVKTSNISKTSTTTECPIIIEWTLAPIALEFEAGENLFFQFLFTMSTTDKTLSS